MFGGDFMIRTDNRPLKETPDVLNSVGMDITPNPLLFTMIDRLMPRVVVSNTLVWRPTISIDSFGIGGSMSFNEVMERSPVSCTNDLKPKRATTFHGTDYDSLIPYDMISKVVGA